VEHEIERVVHDIDALGDDAPDPIAHATPDVELAEAQVALGRPEFAEEGDAPEAEGGGGGRGRLAAGDEFEADEDGGSGSSVAVAEPRAVPGNRLVNFIQGSWRELQRVQWPDRRQVMQATGVVIGFVIVAGVFLGVADFLAGKLMNFVLK
jgi:preprotein translocase subunit SecE